MQRTTFHLMLGVTRFSTKDSPADIIAECLHLVGGGGVVIRQHFDIREGGLQLQMGLAGKFDVDDGNTSTGVDGDGEVEAVDKDLNHQGPVGVLVGRERFSRTSGGTGSRCYKEKVVGAGGDEKWCIC